MSSNRVVRAVCELRELAVDMGRVAVLLAKVIDPRVTVPLLRSVLEVASPDRPLGQLLAKDGGLDTVLDQLVGERGLIDRILAEGGTLDQISDLGTLSSPLHRCSVILAPASRRSRIRRQS